jgi:HD-GYP domain-containing protein (c-di-GMP phosphodiesterase class II)
VQEFESRAFSRSDEIRAIAILSQMERMRPTTYAHSQRVADLAIRVARSARVPENQLHSIYWGALLHDVGELHVRRAVLEKPTSLEPHEITYVREHTLIGSRWVSAVAGLSALVPYVRWHHERFDGEGYPDARSAEGVPLGVALVGVCDAWDALTETRPYREPLSHEEAATEMRKYAGRQWSRALVDWTLDAVEQPEPAAQ